MKIRRIILCLFIASCLAACGKEEEPVILPENHVDISTYHVHFYKDGGTMVIDAKGVYGFWNKTFSCLFDQERKEEENWHYKVIDNPYKDEYPRVEFSDVYCEWFSITHDPNDYGKAIITVQENTGGQRFTMVNFGDGVSAINSSALTINQE